MSKNLLQEYDFKKILLVLGVIAVIAFAWNYHASQEMPSTETSTENNETEKAFTFEFDENNACTPYPSKINDYECTPPTNELLFSDVYCFKDPRTPLSLTITENYAYLNDSKTLSIASAQFNSSAQALQCIESIKNAIQPLSETLEEVTVLDNPAFYLDIQPPEEKRITRLYFLNNNELTVIQNTSLSEERVLSIEEMTILLQELKTRLNK